jgi:hypothetical protein
MKPRTSGPMTFRQRHELHSKLDALTQASSDIRSSSEKRIVAIRRSCRPDIGERSLNQNQARSAKKASKETTGCQSRPGVAPTRTKHEDHAEGKADKVDRPAPESFAPMWCVDWCEEDAEDVQGKPENGDRHGDVEFFHDLGYADGVGSQAERAARRQDSVFAAKNSHLP